MENQVFQNTEVQLLQELKHITPPALLITESHKLRIFQIKKKRWLATQDERSRPSHLAVGGTTIPIEEDFIVGGARMGYAGDPRGGARNVINCRCVILYTSDLDEITS